jgi:hypothetical protein
MSPFIWPDRPVFRTDAEKNLFEALKSQLGPKDAILANTRFTDPQAGDVEIDLIALIDGYGCIVFENKGGRIDFNGQNWIQADRSGKRTIDPHSQVLKNMYAFRDFIRSNWDYKNLKMDWLLAFPDSLIGAIQSPGLTRDRIIDRSELDQAAYRCKMILESVGNRHAPRQSDWVLRAFDAVRGHSFLESDPSSTLENNYNFIKKMTHESERLLDALVENNRIHVTGPAGSGKTWLAFEQARRWTEEGLRVGIAVFNRGLASYIERKVLELGEDQRPTFHGTIHSFGLRLGRTEGEMPNLYENLEGYSEHILKAISKMNESEKFDAWVVDEAQDFKNEWWPFLIHSLKDPANGKLFVAGDPDQSVYGLRGAPEGFFAKLKLKENVRNSEEIALSVAPFVENQLYARGPSSYEVEYIVVESEEAVREAADDAIARLTDEEQWNPGEVALLTTKHRHPVHADHPAPNRDRYWAELWSAEDVFYSTVMGFKGLERSVVVLAINGFHDDADKDDVLYVGMTRARDRLVVVGTKELIETLK